MKATQETLKVGQSYKLENLSRHDAFYDEKGIYEGRTFTYIKPSFYVRFHGGEEVCFAYGAEITLLPNSDKNPERSVATTVK